MDSGKTMSTQPVTIAFGEKHRVSGLLDLPPAAVALYVLAHGAGAGMAHPFMAAVAEKLAERRIATLRYQFPYMEAGGKRPDAPALAQATVRAAVAEAARLAPTLPLIAGGKSFGGRMTSQAQAAEPLPGVRGLAFLGFPLHPTGKPAIERADHLVAVRVPMLFLQGTRDTLAEPELIRGVCEKLGARARLVFFEGGDHSFRVAGKRPPGAPSTMQLLVDALAEWIGGVAGPVSG
jgi:predicted alpha/beta-hydrolase family hydrolase